jgi:hypothetical protein
MVMMNWGGMAPDATRPQVPWDDVDTMSHNPAPLEALDPLGAVEPLTDEELTALALAADPDAPLDEDAVSWSPEAEDGLLPGWYMPAVAGGLPLLHGWRRRVVLLIIASFLLINAWGLCSTYGHVGFG